MLPALCIYCLIYKTFGPFFKRMITYNTPFIVICEEKCLHTHIYTTLPYYEHLRMRKKSSFGILIYGLYIQRRCQYLRPAAVI